MHHLSDLVLDIKCYIASFDPEVWYQLYRYDPEFRTYSLTQDAIKIYKRLFNIMTLRIVAGYTVQHWTLFGRLHRENNDQDVSLPAYYDGSKTIKYYYNGILHRDNKDGKSLPAVIIVDDRDYIVNLLIGDENNILPRRVYFQYEHYKYGIKHRDPDENGNEQPSYHDFLFTKYYKNGLLHRDADKPATTSINGECRYYKNGQLHRDDKNGKSRPAITDVYGNEEYYRHGLRHRNVNENGNHMPAVITQAGVRLYFNNGVEFEP